MNKVLIREPTALDVRIRRAARTPAGRSAARAMSPLFPVGLPGGYLLIAYATARWLERSGRRGGASIVASAWLGWLVQRAMKVVLLRRRPPQPRIRPRFDSFPSGHTTGATALAVTTAVVLHRERVLSARRAAALAFGAPLVMGVYRVVADDHWATDVVGGWALGSAISFLVLKDPRRRQRPRRRARQGVPTSAE